MSTLPTWTEAHRREALRRLYEIAAELVTDGPQEPGYRIDREVRRVRGLAEGRLVRETVWTVRCSAGPDVRWPTREQARAWRRDHAPDDARIVRVTRIRRAHP